MAVLDGTVKVGAHLSTFAHFVSRQSAVTVTLFSGAPSTELAMRASIEPARTKTVLASVPRHCFL